jgi:hypothetical protein
VLSFGQSIVHDLGGLFGSSSDDKDRADRLNFIANAVLAGSVLAARAILGGLTPNGVGAASERNAWTQEYHTLLNDAPAVMAAAQAAGAYWHYGSDAGKNPLSPQLRQEITADLRARGIQYPSGGQYIATRIGSTGSTTSSSSGGVTGATGATTLPGMTTTAAFNWTPYLIGGAGLIGLLAFTRRR